MNIEDFRALYKKIPAKRTPNKKAIAEQATKINATFWVCGMGTVKPKKWVNKSWFIELHVLDLNKGPTNLQPPWPP